MAPELETRGLFITSQSICNRARAPFHNILPTGVQPCQQESYFLIRRIELTVSEVPRLLPTNAKLPSTTPVDFWGSFLPPCVT